MPHLEQSLRYGVSLADTFLSHGRHFPCDVGDQTLCGESQLDGSETYESIRYGPTPKEQKFGRAAKRKQRQRVARAELKQVEQFLRTATDGASARALSERERELVAEARRLRRQLYVRLGPKPPPAAKKAPYCGRSAPAGGIRSVVSGGLPGTGKHR